MGLERIKISSNGLNQNISTTRIAFFLFVYLLKYGHGHSSQVSLRKVPSSQKAHLQSLPRVSPLLGESAIIDKETGRVYWQGGEQSLFHATVGHTYLKNKAGLARHVRATLYSCILWMSVIKFLAKRVISDIDTYLSHLNVITLSDRIRRCITFATNVLRFFLVCLTCLPKFHRSFLIVICICYFIESYTCSTRKYLSNVLLPDKVETYLDLIKEQKPCVKWDIRCFHYEERKFLCMILMVDLWKLLFSLVTKSEEKVENEESGGYDRSPSILSKKIVTHQATQYYKFNSWEDETVSGILKQNEAGTTINSDFTKISMCKLVLFANAKSRADYFIQQSNFVNEEGKKDTFAELSTKVQVQGFKKRMMVVKRSHGFLRNFFSLQYYWLCTCLLLTVPFRIQFSRHCDELHITLAKETSVEVKKNVEGSMTNSWFLSTRSWFSGTRFGSLMNKSSEPTDVQLEDNDNDSSSESNQQLEKTNNNSMDHQNIELQSPQSSEEDRLALLPQQSDETAKDGMSDAGATDESISLVTDHLLEAAATATATATATSSGVLLQTENENRDELTIENENKDNQPRS